MQLPLPLAWAAAIEAEYATSSKWQAFSDKVILLHDNPPIWALEMSLHKKADDVLQHLDGEYPDNCTYREVFCGFRYAIFRDGKMTLKEFCDHDWCCIEVDQGDMSVVFEDVTDAIFTGEDESAYNRWDDAFYALGHTDAQAIEALSETFGPWADRAMELWAYLTSEQAVKDATD
jgi:hypothetical protein